MFDTLAEELPALSSGLEWAINYDANNVMLQVISAALLGDFNDDDSVDAADYVVFRKGLASGDYATWRATFGEPFGSGSGATANATVPEPTTLVLLIVAAVGIRLGRHQIA